MKQPIRCVGILLVALSLMSLTWLQQPRFKLKTANIKVLQTLLDKLPASGGIVICPPGRYVIREQSITLSGKSSVTIVGQSGAVWVNDSPTKATFVATGRCKNIRLTGLHWTSRVQSTAVLPSALLQTYEDAHIDGFELDHCHFTTDKANQNAVGFRPYTAQNEHGLGMGHLLRGVNIHHCVFENVGRMGVELTSHVHADGGSAVYYEDFTFAHNRGTNLGWVDGKHGMLLSLSGIGRRIIVNDNSVTDARYAGLEFVACQQVKAINNRFSSTGKTTYSAYAISPAGSLRPAHVSVSGGGGYVKGRPFILYGVDQFSVRGGNWTSENPTDIRGRHGTLSGVHLTVTTGVEGGGGNAIQLHECENVLISGCTLTLTSTRQTNYSVVDFGTARSNTHCSLLNNVLKRPPNGLDNFVHTDAGHMHSIKGNKETN